MSSRTLFPFLLSFLLLLPHLADSKTSGLDIAAEREKVRAVRSDAESLLRSSGERYMLLKSSALPAPEAMAEYRDGLLEAGESVKLLAYYAGGISAFVEKAEQEVPLPDDIRDLLELRSYCRRSLEEARTEHKQALRSFIDLEKRLLKVPVPPDGSAAGAEKERLLRAARKARELGDKRAEFNEIARLSAVDPSRGGELLGNFFDGASSGEGGVPVSRANIPAPGAVVSGGVHAQAARRPGSAYKVPVPPVTGPASAAGLARAGAGEARPAKSGGGATGEAGRTDQISPGTKLSFWSAVAGLSPSLAAPHLREASLGQAAEAKAAWLSKKREDFLALAAKSNDPGERAAHEATARKIEQLLAKRAEISGRGTNSGRGESLGEWNSSVTRLLENSVEGRTERELADRKYALDSGYAALKTDAERAAWLRSNGAAYDANGEKLGAFYQGNREYLAARKADAESQRFLRANLHNFGNGTGFTASELGLPLPAGQKVSVGAIGDGTRGVTYRDPSGNSHFQSFDDTVRVDEALDGAGRKISVETRLAADGAVNTAERLPDGKLLRTEQRSPDGTVTVELYSPEGKPYASRLVKPDGSMVEAAVLQKEGVKRTVYTDPKGNASYEVLPLDGGYPRQTGRIVNGVPVVDRLELDASTAKVRTAPYLLETRVNGKADGLEVDAEGIRRLPQAERAAAAKETAAALAGGDPDKAGPLYQFITQASRQGGPDTRTSIFTARDDKGSQVFVAGIRYPDGSVKEVLGQWDKLSKLEAQGLKSDVGLNISVRSGASEQDIARSQYHKILRFCGDDVTDRYSSQARVTGNWFTGYGAVADNYVHRVQSGTNQEIRSIKTGKEELFTSPTIFGHTGAALGTMGKGAVQLTGSAMAVVGAGTVGWADRNLQAEFLERAKSNFYGNEVSRSLGQNYIGSYYNEGYALMKVDEARNIQNVGKEMASMGRPTLGAVLQGGVNYSNGVAVTLITAPLGGPMTGALGKTGTVGRAIRTTAEVAGKGYGAYRSGKDVYDTGAAGVQFVQAWRGYNENDPASKERYYSAITELTEKGLSAPDTLSGVFKLGATVKQARGALAGKTPPSPILGPDGKPYVAPPAELSDFRKFMLEKNAPGLLTRVMTREVSGGLDPKIGGDFANSPVAKAVGAAEQWASAKVDGWLGRSREMPKPALIIPGQAAPRPEVKIITSGDGRPNPNPEGKIIVPGNPEPRPDVKLVVPGQAEPRPDAKIIVDGL